MVFGVVNNDRSICGSRFRENPIDLDSLKQEVAAQTTGNHTFLDIHVVNHPDGRVVMFQIPPASHGVPAAWKGHWYGRHGESIGPLSLQELETIRALAAIEDWSTGICADATPDDLDVQAIATARANFRAKNQDKPFAAEIDSWSDTTFLDRAKITGGGRITRAALLLLGRPEAVHYLHPAVAHIASATDDKAQYIKNRAFDDAHYKQMVIEYLKKYGDASRQDIDTLLLGKLSDLLDENQKQNKVKNLLYAMSRRDKTICNVRSGSTSRWKLNLDEKSENKTRSRPP